MLKFGFRLLCLFGRMCIVLTGKKIVLGVTGGIAAYKACDLVSRLKKRGAEVRVVMTETRAGSWNR